MRWRALCLALCCATPSSARADDALDFASTPQDQGSIGFGAGYPDIGFAWVSFWLIDQVTVDARLGLASLDGGFTLHMPFAQRPAVTHSLLIGSVIGYYHNLAQRSRLDMFAHGGTHVALSAGYGFVVNQTMDFRCQAGFDLANYNNRHVWMPSFHLMVGKIF